MYVDHTVNGYTTDVTEAVSKAQQGMVTVTSYMETERIRSISGIIYSSSGEGCDILTNARIIEEDVRITVRFDNGIELDAEVLGSDAKSDLAVLRTHPEFQAEPMHLTDSDRIKQGEYMITVSGRRTDTLHSTVSFGVVSSPGQMFRAGDESSSPWLLSVIESDASLNQTNTGGPLLNLSGEVSAVLSQALTSYSASAGMIYGVCSNEARLIADEIRRDREVIRGYLGASGTNIEEMEVYQKSALNMSLEQIDGIYIIFVAVGSPAEEAGVLEGDILTGINETEIGNSRELMEMLYSLSPEETVQLHLIRQGETMTLEAVLK